MSDVTLPNTLTPGANENVSDVQENDEALRDHINGDGWVEDAKLASPNNSVYKMLFEARGALGGALSAGTFMFSEDLADNDAGPNMKSSPLNMMVGGLSPSDGTMPNLLYLDGDDYAVGGLTTRLRVRGVAHTNGTVPAITFTFGLYPVTFSGAADVLTATLGTVVSSSTAAVASPAANSVVAAVSSDFAVPSDGAYALGVVTSGALTANAAVMIAAALQIRNT